MNTECIPSTNHGGAIAVACQSLLREAERELGAFLNAVASTFGYQAAKHAAEQWVEILESDVAFIHNPAPSFRNITIQTATCLASSWIKQSHYPLALSDEGISGLHHQFFFLRVNPPARRYSPSVRLCNES
jgi:hypothetical protein